VAGHLDGGWITTLLQANEIVDEVFDVVHAQSD